MTPRYEPLYHRRAARGGPGRGKQRHLFRAAGVGVRSICGDAQFTAALLDDAFAVHCAECRLVAITELALAVDDLGMNDLAVRVAAHAAPASYETHAAQSA